MCLLEDCVRLCLFRTEHFIELKLDNAGIITIKPKNHINFQLNELDTLPLHWSNLIKSRNGTERIKRIAVYLTQLMPIRSVDLAARTDAVGKSGSD